MKSAYILDGLRTPIGSFKGSLSTVRPDDMAALVIKELIQRNAWLPVENINDVILGCANQAGEDNRNIARMALLLAGVPYTCLLYTSISRSTTLAAVRGNVHDGTILEVPSGLVWVISIISFLAPAARSIAPPTPNNGLPGTAQLLSLIHI